MGMGSLESSSPAYKQLNDDDGDDDDDDVG